MTSEEFKAARKAIAAAAPNGRCSQSELARLIGASDSRTIRRYEDGTRTPGGSVVTALNYILQGCLDDRMRQILPEHVLSVDASGESDVQLIQRMHRPRFIAVVMAEEAEGLQSIEVAPGEWLTVAMWIDDPTAGFDEKELLARAASALDIYTADSFSD